ncbi:HepT-like ribonuclease domain-containing protein [Marinobacterium sedimentorum]|uniref:HepT-like ribonuclease domain-containing protein n=1 Tax=Marinobacterium sedimentorum TaxID=2927804 RepID=UPI0020C602C5|nr:HepT-like ribonuclease domain-containing protein [Marinobacterium sedimentorum]MCP8689379.1 DUF86 domain-containing protein [Marinobacterium sedimentorum]
MLLEEKKYLYDILQAIERIERFASGKTISDYLQDEMLQAAIERQFEIMGEAVNKLSKVSAAIADQLPNKRKMISFRNILIHAYDTIDPMIVWGVVEKDSAKLKEVVEQLLTTNT